MEHWVTKLEEKIKAPVTVRHTDNFNSKCCLPCDLESVCVFEPHIEGRYGEDCLREACRQSGYLSKMITFDCVCEKF